MKNITVTAAAVLLTACATGVVPMDHGTYMIGKTSPAGAFATSDGSKAYVYEEANAFCAEKGLQVETIKVEAREGRPFVRASSAELQFKCVPVKVIK